MQLPGAGSDGLMLETLWDTAGGSSWDGGACGEMYYKDKTARQAEEVKKPAWNSSANTKVGEEKGRGDVHPTACGVSHAGADGCSWMTLSPWEWSHTGAGAKHRVKDPRERMCYRLTTTPTPHPELLTGEEVEERMKGWSWQEVFLGKTRMQKNLFFKWSFLCVWLGEHLATWARWTNHSLEVKR